MKDNFTEQQREIVARKMGFDGPMQNFGEFLMSSPATATQYSAVAARLGQKTQGFAAGGVVKPSENLSYVDKLKQVSPDAYEKIAKLASFTANENYGGKVQDYQAQIFTPLSATLVEQANIKEGLVPVEAGYDDGVSYTTTVTGYTKDLGVVNGIAITANYDANKKLTGYSGPSGQRSWLDGKTSVSGNWDATGNAAPAQYRSKGGGFLKNLVSDIGGSLGDVVGDIASGITQGVSDLYMEVRDPVQAAAVVAGNYLVPGSGVVTSQLVSDDAKEILATDLGKAAMIGSGIAGASAGNTFSNAGARFDAATAGSAASTGTTAVPYTGAMSADNIDIGGGYNPATGAGDAATAAGAAATGIAPVTSTSANAADNIDVGGGYNPATGAGDAATAAGAAATGVSASALTPGVASAVSSGLKTGTDSTTTTSGLDDSAFYGAILGLLKNRYEKYSETKTELGLAQGGDVKRYAEGGVLMPDGTIGVRQEPVVYGPPTPTTNADGSPVAPIPTLARAETTTITPAMSAAAPPTVVAQQATSPVAVAPVSAAAPTAVNASTITASSSQPAIAAAMDATKAEQGTVGTDSLVKAVTQDPTTTALSGVQAEQGTATKVVAPVERTLQAGETVSSAVDQTRVSDALAKNVAEQGTVTSEMTVQGQLNTMLSNFDAGNPPPWAAGTMRTAMAQMAARGLGASSLAGQAVVQAALEAATPIAAADAKVFEQMGLTNLSNRQQMALVTSEQRAKFLGQEFDQQFQSRVVNAAKISDIANKNFDAATTIALENARIANSMDIANLSARNAIVLAQAAQMANLETANLNNRQQVAVENAKAFLQTDLTNLSNRQQTSLFKSQQIAQSILADTAAENAAKAVNATNALDASKLNAQLALTASQFSAAEQNKVNLANSAMATDVLKFNAQEANDRADFNANMATQINMANAKILADVSTANTRETNAMNAVNAKNSTDLSAAAYAQLSQTYRDKLEMSWKTSDNELSRANSISVATIASNATIKSAQLKADGDFAAAMGTLVAKIGTTSTTGGGTVISDAWDWLKTKVTG